jgi:hypothetical protein
VTTRLPRGGNTLVSSVAFDAGAFRTAPQSRVARVVAAQSGAASSVFMRAGTLRSRAPGQRRRQKHSSRRVLRSAKRDSHWRRCLMAVRGPLRQPRRLSAVPAAQADCAVLSESVRCRPEDMRGSKRTIGMDDSRKG